MIPLRRQCLNRKAAKKSCRRPTTHVARIFTPNGLVQFEMIGCLACVEAWAAGHAATAYETRILPIADAAPLVSTRLASGTQGFIPSPTWSKVTT